MRLLLIGNRGGTNVGSSFERAALLLGHSVTVLEPRHAFAGSKWLQRFNWWVRGRRPARMGEFDDALLAAADREQPTVAVSVGISPPGYNASAALRCRGIRLLNYLTDDPWQRGLRATWFIKALPAYSTVFTTKRALVGDLQAAGASKVIFLPFAYDPELHFPAELGSSQQFVSSSCEVFFAGGGDKDRFPLLRALIQAGCRVMIHGAYWDRDPVTRTAWRGHAGPEQLRQATTTAQVCLCLVRRANRDGHVMRTFEIAAMGGCMLAENTEEHREIFGADGECAVFFRNEREMVEKARWLLAHPEERSRLAVAAHLRITGGQNTYLDRLGTMLEV